MSDSDTVTLVYIIPITCCVLPSLSLTPLWLLSIDPRRQWYLILKYVFNHYWGPSESIPDLHLEPPGTLNVCRKRVLLVFAHRQKKSWEQNRPFFFDSTLGNCMAVPCMFKKIRYATGLTQKQCWQESVFWWNFLYSTSTNTVMLGMLSDLHCSSRLAIMAATSRKLLFLIRPAISQLKDCFIHVYDNWMWPIISLAWHKL